MDRLIEITDLADIRAGDMVTATRPEWGDGATVTGPALPLGEHLQVCGMAIVNASLTVLHVTRVVAAVTAEVGAVYGRTSADGKHVVACVSTADELGWLGGERAPGVLGYRQDRRWLKTEDVQKLVDEHGYKRLDGGEAAS